MRLIGCKEDLTETNSDFARPSPNLRFSLSASNLRCSLLQGNEWVKGFVSRATETLNYVYLNDCQQVGML